MIEFILLFYLGSSLSAQNALANQECQKNFDLATQICLEPDPGINPAAYDTGSFSGRAQLANDTYMQSAGETQKCGLVVGRCETWCAKAKMADQRFASFLERCQSGDLKSALMARKQSLEAQQSQLQSLQVAARKASSGASSPTSNVSVVVPPEASYYRDGSIRAPSSAPSTLNGAFNQDRQDLRRGQEAPRQGVSVSAGIKVGF